MTRWWTTWEHHHVHYHHVHDCQRHHPCCWMSFCLSLLSWAWTVVGCCFSPMVDCRIKFFSFSMLIVTFASPVGRLPAPLTPLPMLLPLPSPSPPHRHHIALYCVVLRGEVLQMHCLRSWFCYGCHHHHHCISCTFNTNTKIPKIEFDWNS